MLSAYEAVRETWKPLIKGDFETGWRKALHQGWIDGTAFDQVRRARSVPASVQGRFPTPASEGRARDHLPARSECL
jgi:hypothetical protein